jgi:hypothetical protein
MLGRLGRFESSNITITEDIKDISNGTFRTFRTWFSYLRALGKKKWAYKWRNSHARIRARGHDYAI